MLKAPSSEWPLLQPFGSPGLLGSWLQCPGSTGSCQRGLVQQGVVILRGEIHSTYVAWGRLVTWYKLRYHVLSSTLCTHIKSHPSHPSPHPHIPLSHTPPPPPPPQPTPTLGPSNTFILSIPTLPSIFHYKCIIVLRWLQGEYFSVYVLLYAMCLWSRFSLTIGLCLGYSHVYTGRSATNGVGVP